MSTKSQDSVEGSGPNYSLISLLFYSILYMSWLNISVLLMSVRSLITFVFFCLCIVFCLALYPFLEFFYSDFLLFLSFLKAELNLV